MLDDNHAFDAGGTGTQGYADAMALYLAFGIDLHGQLLLEGMYLALWSKV